MQGVDSDGKTRPEWGDLTQGVAWCLELIYDGFVHDPKGKMGLLRELGWPLMKVRFLSRFCLEKEERLTRFLVDDRSTQISKWTFWLKTSFLKVGLWWCHHAILPNLVE